MCVAGRDETKLFCTSYATPSDSVLTAATALTYAWVNVDFMLDASLVEFSVPEPSS